MASMSNEILSALPASLRRRFASLGKYTQDITVRQLEERLSSFKERKEFLRTHLSSIQGAVLAISIYRYLGDGIAAADGAVEIANSLGAEGFSVGKTDFSKQSKDIDDWRKIHAQLGSLLKESGIDRHEKGRHPWDFVESMLEELLNA